MAVDDRAAALDAALDAVIAGVPAGTGTMPEEQLAMLRRLHAGWLRPTPDPDFVRRLRSDLVADRGQAPAAAGHAAALPWPAQRAASGRPSEPWAPPHRHRRLPIAFAALALCLVVGLVAVALTDRDGGRRETIPALAVASPPASPRAVLLVIDKSGSMSYDPLGGTSKIEMAKQAARDTLARLAPGDWFGVLAFNDQQAWVVPLAPLPEREQRQDAAAAIDGITADGGTEIHPALSTGLDALRNAAPAERHLVLLTDGKSRTGTREAYQALVEPAVSDGIVISTVAIGNDADRELTQFLAELGGGTYHFAQRPEEIPEGVAAILGFSSAATPEPAPAAPSGIDQTPVTVPIMVDGAGLLRGDGDADQAAVEQLEAGLAPFAAAGCRIGFVITEAEAPDVATGNQIADAVNALLLQEFPELAEGAGFYSFANVAESAGTVNLLIFPNAGCELP